MAESLFATATLKMNDSPAQDVVGMHENSTLMVLDGFTQNFNHRRTQKLEPPCTEFVNNKQLHLGKRSTGQVFDT